MFDELLPIIIIIVVLLVVYFIMKIINRKLRNRVSKSDYRRRRNL
ncbi:MAG: hypothetical protein RQ743_05820 [Bacteroidales bacterium]|nr:hypothetical protein [Bacteroidales bacterium]